MDYWVKGVEIADSLDNTGSFVSNVTTSLVMVNVNMNWVFMLIWLFDQVFIVFIILGLNMYEISKYVKVYSMSGPLYNSALIYIYIYIYIF